MVMHCGCDHTGFEEQLSAHDSQCPGVSSSQQASREGCFGSRIRRKTLMPVKQMQKHDSNEDRAFLISAANTSAFDRAEIG